MCGITGYIDFSGKGAVKKEHLEQATQALNLRGPDFQDTFLHEIVGLGHARLSILDTSAAANQPMRDSSGRYTLVFNGEIYNYQELQKALDVPLQTTSDTEVLLQLLIKEGTGCLPKLNGFFAFAFYDQQKGTLLLARDHMGIKPLLYYQDDHRFLFASEMKALGCYPFSRKLNHESLYWYLKLNYLPGTMSMLEGVKKLSPGHYLEVANGKVTESPFLQSEKPSFDGDYASAQKQLESLLEASVQKRMIADVPLGAFLSGGTDSSAIVSLASRHTKKLSTFSIGYSDNPFFDETHYAELVAKKFNTDHHTFKLSNDDLLADLDDIISYIDEPFADSSAIPTYILSKHTRKHVTVALSGDGADELFGGYYKHLALALNTSGQSLRNEIIKITTPLLKMLPKSRDGKVSNLIRRVVRFGDMLKLDPVERYWFLASLTNDPSFLLLQNPEKPVLEAYKQSYFIGKNPSLTDYLQVDQQMLLPGDMLTKVDLMSMANSLEVRVPFLDRSVVNFANGLPENFKISGQERKRILQDTFRDILPAELHHRPKQGFEVPLLQWMRKELLTELDQTLFNESYLSDQGIFRVEQVLALRKKMLSKNPEDVHGTIWALYIFQKWYQKWM